MDESTFEKVSFERKFGKELCATIPACPGVYFFWDKSHTVIYIGKAKNLRRRLGQYKNASRLERHAKMRLLIKEAHEISWVECQTDLEACETEVKLIQQYKPSNNIASKFSFMYPYIGLKFSERNLELLLTTVESQIKDFEVFGAFRSNRKTRDAFFSLVKLMQILYRSKAIRSQVTYTHRILFEKLEDTFATSLGKFLSGKDESFLSDLTLLLVEKKLARVRSEFVQESIDELRRFFRREARRLNHLKVKVGFTEPYVSQNLREILHLRLKFKEPIP